LKSWTEAAAWTSESSLYRNQSWDDNPDLFGIKIARDIARAFLKHATLSVSPPDFLNCGGDRNHAVGDPFRHFQRFYSLTALLREFSQFYDIFFIICTLINNNFYPRRLFATLTSAAKKICPSVRAQTGWGGDI
jgi:hypothetical protein